MDRVIHFQKTVFHFQELYTGSFITMAWIPNEIFLPVLLPAIFGLISIFFLNAASRGVLDFKFLEDNFLILCAD